MDDLRQLAQMRNYFLRREAVALGVDDRTLHRQRRSGRLVRIRQGAYSYADLWAASTDVGRHLARAQASQDLTRGRTALSHMSALAHFEAPLWDVPLDAVHLTRLDKGSSRHEAGVVHHQGDIRPEEVQLHNGRWVTSPTRSVLDAMTLLSTESSMVVGDWMLRQELTTEEMLWKGKALMNRWPGTLRQEVIIRLLDGRSQSVGETRCRHVQRVLLLPRAHLQYPIYFRGELIAITDFAWPWLGVYGEFDGKVKYGRLLKPGQDAGDVVFAEKRREDAIRRATGGTVIRWTWSDLHPQSEPSQQAVELLRAVA